MHMLQTQRSAHISCTDLVLVIVFWLLYLIGVLQLHDDVDDKDDASG